MSLPVYELTTLEIKVFSNAAVYEALKRELPGAGGELLGVFASDIGDLSRVLVLRRFDSGDASAQARLQLLLRR
ncbi:MAG: NIPSNAP family protein [Pseudomonadota bacterium]